MRRPQPTFADYIITALSPALIMLLVGSLVFFLIQVFYQGEYDGRLTFIMAMFVMAAVLIARISIEQSREYAMLFAIPLAIVTAIATIRFVEFRGPLESFSHFVNLGLIALIWWCADRLTWDSTVIDESKDASGEGLLQTAGLDDQATTQNAASLEDSKSQPQQSVWQRFLAHRRRGHAPGLWVIYFSLAALPIFGFGNWFVPSDDLQAKRYVFKLLVLYVGSALGLLLTTSFLNLRRYLRQRRLEMPIDMATAWIGTGAAMIVTLLLVCTLLPRRNPEYSITQLPIFAGSPTDLWTTEYAVGNEGQEDPEKADRPGDRRPDPNSPTGGQQPSPSQPTPNGQPSEKNSPGGQQQPGGQQGTGQGKDQGGDKKPGGQQEGQPGGQSGGQSQGGSDSGAKKQPTGKGNGPTGKSGPGEQQPQGPSEKGPSSPKSEDSPDPEKEPGQGRKNDDKGGDPKETGNPDSNQPKPSDQSGGNRQADDDRQPRNSENESKNEPSQEGRQSPSTASSEPKATSKFDPSKIASALGGTIGQLLKLLYWVIALAIIAFFAWKYWRQIREALANFMKAMREFWESLFGRKTMTGSDESAVWDAAPPPVPFASFHDPFLTGMAESKPSVEVIRYSFAALEAWAREFGCARTPDQTPHEFVQVMGAQQVAVARDAAILAEMYNRCAYARDASQRMNVEPLRKLWQQMRESVGA